MTPHPPPYLVFPGDRVPGLRSVFRYLYEAHPGWLDKLKGSSRQGTGPILALVGKLGPGYLSANDGIVRLHSGQVFAIALGTITTLIYQWAGRYSYPALVYALLYMMATCWCLSALAFFFRSVPFSTSVDDYPAKCDHYECFTIRPLLPSVEGGKIQFEIQGANRRLVPAFGERTSEGHSCGDGREAEFRRRRGPRKCWKSWIYRAIRGFATRSH